MAIFFSRHTPLALVAFFAVLVPALAGDEIAYPCHQNKKSVPVDNVTCTSVALPKGLCTACPLRPTTENGKFFKCWDTYNTSAPACLPAMQDYVAANPCDGKRAKAVAALAENPADTDARAVVDYFLYSVCEQCCDCVPMGSSQELYPEYAATHTAAVPTLYSTTRGNCPAHAFFDVCMILPDIKYFTRVGEKADPALKSMPKACPMLTAWAKSNESRAWQENPKTKLAPALNNFMLNMLDRLECASKTVWDKCYILEAAQDHLGVPDDHPEVSETTSTPTATASASATATTTTTPSSSPSASASASTSALPYASPSLWPGEARRPFDVPYLPGRVGGPFGTTPSEHHGDGDDDHGPFRGIHGHEPGPGLREDYAFAFDALGNIIGTKPSSPSEACFPSSATVSLRNGARIPMSSLPVGDEVLVAPGKFSRVYFSLHDASTVGAYLRVTVTSGAVLTLSPGLYLPVNGMDAPASSIVPGDVLVGVGGAVTVKRVSKVTAQGLYNPHTVAGTIVVDDVVCSTYTTAVVP